MNKIVVVVILFGILAIVIGCFVDLGVSVYKANQMEKNTKFPPWPAKCPDYWAVDEINKDGITCRNVHGLGDCKNKDYDPIMKFEGSEWKGAKGMHYKCNWAKACNVSWEGVDSIC